MIIIIIPPPHLDVFRDDLGQVEVSEGSHQDHFLVHDRLFSSQCSGNDQNRFDGSVGG